MEFDVFPNNASNSFLASLAALIAALSFLYAAVASSAPVTTMLVWIVRSANPLTPSPAASPGGFFHALSSLAPPGSS